MVIGGKREGLMELGREGGVSVVREERQEIGRETGGREGGI